MNSVLQNQVRVESNVLYEKFGKLQAMNMKLSRKTKILYSWFRAS